MDTTSIRIWDLPIRIFHWTLVASIGFAWFTAESSESWMEWHERTGIFILSLVIWRIIWGFVGSDTARFSQFLKSPFYALHHLQEMRQQATAYHAGHNPLGAWMVIALLAMILVQGLTGLFATDDIATEGPLAHLVSGSTSETLTSLHHLGFNIILMLAAIHIAAVLFYRFAKQTNLIKTMVLGTADWPNAQQPKPETLQFKAAWIGFVLWVGVYVLLNFVLKLAA
jgi:cytochrome b